MRQPLNTRSGTEVNRRMGRPRKALALRRARAATDDEISDLLTLEQVIARLGFASHKSVYLLREMGRLHPVRKPGESAVYYLAFEVDEILTTPVESKTA